MAKKETSKKEIKTFVGKRVSMKQYKLLLATAPTREAQRAIKRLWLSEPVKIFAKSNDEPDNSGVETDLPVKNSR